MSRIIRLSEDRRGHVDKDPALTADADGRLWVAWHSYREKEDRILIRSFKGNRRGKVLEISDRPGINFQPKIACDGHTVWVVWVAMREDRWCILARSVTSRGMGAVVRLSENEAEEAFPAVATGACGRIWAAWTSLGNGRRQVFGRFLSDGTWSDPILLSSGSGEHYRPVLCGDTDGVWLAYGTCRKGAYDLYVRQWTPEGIGRPSKFSLTDSWELFPRLCADGEGGVWAAWAATHDVMDDRGIVDHKVDLMASHFDGKGWTPYRSSGRNRPIGYVTHLYDALLGREHYWGFLGWRRRPQLVREADGDVWVLYERKEDESANRHGPDAAFYARSLTGKGRSRSYEVDQDVYAYTVNGDLPVVAGRLPVAAQISSGKYYADICAGYLALDRSRPIKGCPASDWKRWKPVRLPQPAGSGRRPTMTVGGKTYKLYWGDPHCHGNLSGDAEGEIDENYTYGRVKSRLDFMAVTDNDAIYDNAFTPSEWALIRAEAAYFDNPGRFVAISAYERTFNKYDGRGPNHRIIMFPHEDGQVYRYTEPDADSLEKWVALMRDEDAFTFAHHDRWWTIPDPSLGGAELCSCWDIYIHLQDTIPRHLREGYRLAFMGNSDSHRIVPGMGGALTGVWAEDLTREGIFEALRARRCFATNGERVTLDVRVNGAPMGSEVAVEGEVRVDCRIHAPRMVQRVDLFRDGEQVLGRTVGKRRATLKFTDTPEPGRHFYYVQVSLKPIPRKAMGGRCGNLQVAVGDYAWSSPIWVARGVTGEK